MGVEHSGAPEDADGASVDPMSWQTRVVVERLCWISALLAPIVYWVQGPAVSTDQRVVRVVVFSAFLVSALFLRWRSRRERNTLQ